MKDKLEKLLNNSYSPYSKFAASCILITNDLKEFSGVNVENASYGATNCAERTAIFSAIANGYKPGELKEIHIMVSSGNIAMPCFLCRQVIFELMDKDAKIYCYSKKGDIKVYTKAELCPYPFGSDDLI